MRIIYAIPAQAMPSQVGIPQFSPGLIDLNQHACLGGAIDLLDDAPSDTTSPAWRTDMVNRFKDRAEAGRKLADALDKKYAGEEGVVYPLPRGGIPLGLEIARRLNMPIDLVIPRKIGHPFNPEYAICAVCENGGMVCNEWEVSQVDPAWFEQRLKSERKEARRRRERYLGGRGSLPVTGKVAILVDDGIATGLTMRAAIRDLRHRNPARIVVAIPVSPKDTAALLKPEVDELVALDIPDFYLGAVGAYYMDFPQITDDQVVEFLQRAETRKKEHLPSHKNG
jgi:putative phosphoribosyl transferase